MSCSSTPDNGGDGGACGRLDDNGNVATGGVAGDMIEGGMIEGGGKLRGGAGDGGGGEGANNDAAGETTRKPAPAPGMPSIAEETEDET